MIIKLIQQSNSTATLVKHDFNLESQYESANGKCLISFGIVVDDEYQVTLFSNNQNIIYGGDSRLYYDGSLQVFRLSTYLPVGLYTNIPLNVTNSNGQNSSITVTNSFECKKLSITSPLFNYSKISKFYYLDSYFGYTVNIDFDQQIPAGSITCSISISKSCFVNKYPTYFTISTISNYFDYNKLSSDKVTITIKDSYGGVKEIIVDNNILEGFTKESVIKSIYANPPNNTLVARNTIPSQIIRVQVTYSEIDSFTILRKDPSTPVFGSLVLGTPEEQVMLYTSLLDNNQQDYTYFDYSPEISNPFTLNYTGYVPQNPFWSSFYPTGSAIQSTTGNILFKTNVDIPEYRDDIQVSSVYNYNDAFPSPIFEYPYGLSKINKNSYCTSNTETLLPFSTLGGTFSIGYDRPSNVFHYTGYVGNYSTSTSSISSYSIPDYPGIIKSDPEGPLLRHFSVQVLENSKYLFTFNITDVGSGLLYIMGLSPFGTYLAKEYLVSGNINNGIYQILSDSFYVGDIVSVMCYDYMGNYNLDNQNMFYSDTNLNGMSIYNTLTADDITYFKFDRLSIDTSFDDLDLTLSINYTGANQYSNSPTLVVLYLDMRYGGSVYQGVWNKTTQLFDIKLKVQARERGYFSYTITSPFMAYLYQLEQMFPDQRVLLTSNYVDHYPPIITNLKSITSTQLNIQNGASIELGWDVEIYDYPVGLDYAIIEVSSNKDYEPRVFNLLPDSTISGSDINSTYPIRFTVKPLVDQVFFISKVTLYDKNGYYSTYPDQSTATSGFNAFFKDEFTSERNITVTLDSQSNDIKAPQLLSFNFPTTFDSFGIDRVATFEFSLKDDISGVSERHYPYIYVQSLFSLYYRAKSERVSFDPNTNISTYQAKVTFDYGRLAYGALVSIHGIVDNALNLISHTSEDLKSLGFPSTMINLESSKPPVILEYSELNEDGGKFYLYGRAFTESPVVYMNKGDGFAIVPLEFQSNLAITVNVPSVKGIASIQFKIISNSKESNIITVKPIVNPVEISDCSSLNNCNNGNGQCINSKCICNIGYSGPDCSSTPTDITTKPNTTPSFNTFSSMIILNELVELDIYSNVIQKYPLTEEIWTSSTIPSKLQEDANAYQYIGPLGETGSTITIVVDIFDKENKVSFAGYDFQMNSGTVKYTISLDSYPFSSRLNTLQLNVNASIDVADSKCKLNSIKLNENNCVEWIKLRSDTESLYGKFIEHALIDYRSVSIQNKLIVEPNLNDQHAVIGIQIPYYYQTAVLDPDFSVIFDFDDLGKNKESSCYLGAENGNGNNDNNGGLSKSKVIGISVACGVVGLAATVAVVYVIKNNRKMFKLKKKLSVS